MRVEIKLIEQPSDVEGISPIAGRQFDSIEDALKAIRVYWPDARAAGHFEDDDPSPQQNSPKFLSDSVCAVWSDNLDATVADLIDLREQHIREIQRELWDELLPEGGLVDDWIDMARSFIPRLTTSTGDETEAKRALRYVLVHAHGGELAGGKHVDLMMSDLK